MARRIAALTTSEPTVAAAATAFLAQRSLVRSTRRSYAQTLGRLEHELGGDRPLSAITVGGSHGGRYRGVGERAPATWNRQVSAVKC